MALADDVAANRGDVEAKLRILEAIGLAIATGGPLDTVLEVLMELVLQAVPAEAATIFLMEPPDNEIRFAVTRGPRREGLGGLKVKLGEGIVGWVIQHNAHLIVDDVRGDPRFAHWFDEHTGFETRDVLCVPLVARHGVIGAIEMLNRKSGTFSDAEAHYLTTIGSQMAQMVEGVRLFEQQQRALRTIYALKEAGRWLNSSLELDRVLDAIVRMAGDVVHAEAGSILLREPTGRLRFLVAFGPRAAALMASQDAIADRLEQGVAGWVARHGTPQLITDCANDPRFAAGPGSSIGEQIGFQTRSMLCVPMRHREQTMGVLQLINRADGRAFTEHDLQAVSAFADDAAAALVNARLYESLEQSYLYTIDSLVTALDARDNETGGHSQRVALYARAVAELLGMDAEAQDTVYQGSLLHDIGKIGIPDAILRKPGKLTDDEFAIMKRHTIIGYRILKGISFLERAAVIPLFHHERFDGLGYPYGLRRDDIPLGARIFAIVDTFDAMTSDRVYRKALSYEAACQEIRDCSDSQFDREVADAFLSIPFEHIRTIRERVAASEAQSRPLRAEIGSVEEDYEAARSAYVEMKDQGVV